MLVEVGIGFPLHEDEKQAQPLAARVNSELFKAFNYAKDEKRWKDFDYPDYMSAVRHCLEPDTFDQAPYVEESSTREWKEALKQRRNILYDKVVFPLEDLLQGMKWMNDITKIAPLDMPSKVTAIQEPTVVPENPKERKVLNPKKKRTKNERCASEWLLRLKGFNRELAQVAPAVGLKDPSRRVRIAVLDTGYDDNAPFFFLPDVEGRLKGWKDWVDGSDQPKDLHGHGTHLVSLVLKCAPEADIYVSRIAESPNQLLDSSKNVAKVCISRELMHYPPTDLFRRFLGQVETGRPTSSPCRSALRTSSRASVMPSGKPYTSAKILFFSLQRRPITGPTTERCSPPDTTPSSRSAGQMRTETLKIPTPLRAKMK